MRVRDSDLDAVTTIDGDDADIGEINEIVGFHIRLAHGACYRHFTETFAELELTQKQVSVMWLVADHPGISQIDLGQHLRMDRATTMTIINRLQARHYLRREKSPTDGRKQALFLTAQGEQALADAKRAVREHENWVKSRFTDAEVKTLMELLARIHE
jgi:DNA-binding MarR family transcriptional regulator